VLVPYDGLIKFTIAYLAAYLNDPQINKPHLIWFQGASWYGCTSENKKYKQKQDYDFFSVCIYDCIIHSYLSSLPSDLFDVMLPWHEGILLHLPVFVYG
jgi:hypothetical protein